MTINAILLRWDSCVMMDTAIRMSTAKLLKYDGNRQMVAGCISVDSRDALVTFRCSAVLPEEASCAGGGKGR